MTVIDIYLIESQSITNTSKKNNLLKSFHNKLRIRRWKTEPLTRLVEIGKVQKRLTCQKQAHCVSLVKAV